MRYGSASGLDPSTDELWHQDVPGVPDTNEKADFFGYAIAAGDLDGDGADDLAIGAPREDLGDTGNAGSVTVIFGSDAGLVSAGAQRWTQSNEGVPDRPEGGDQFGFALAIANYGRSSRADLAVGVALEDLGSIKRAGLVNVLYGSPSGPTGTNAQAWTQNSAGIGGSAERDDRFGSTLGPNPRQWRPAAVTTALAFYGPSDCPGFQPPDARSCEDRESLARPPALAHG